MLVYYDVINIWYSNS